MATNPSKQSDDASNTVRLGFLQEFNLKREFDDQTRPSLNLMLLLRVAPNEQAEAIVMKFMGVVDLRIGSLDRQVRLQMEVRSIRERQLEGLHYRVVESEYEALSFYCLRWDVAPATDR